jgi:hypothetical protein
MAEITKSDAPSLHGSSANNGGAVESLLADSAELTADAVEFNRQNQLTKSLETCLQFARRHLSYLGKANIYLSQDPEDDQQWLVVRVKTPGPAPQAANAYESYLRDWVASVDWERRKLIRLSCTIA